MNTRGRGAKDNGVGGELSVFRMAPVARVITLMLAAIGAAGAAHAQQRAFSAAWMAQKNIAQGQAIATGRLPNGLPVSSLNTPSAQQQQAREQLQRSLGNLNLAAQSIAAQQAAQAAARQAALDDPSSVPDGLADGGLRVDTNSLTAGWLNAQAPVQSQGTDGRTTVTIQQTGDRAILNWETFNVGKRTTVDFRQQADWAVLNRVNDPQARPSQIQGQIKADGTVLIANRNGIVFSGSSQTDTRNLVAAAAKIGDDQFKTRGIYSAQASGAYTPSFTDADGKVDVQAGARINTTPTTTVTQGGGYALLLGKEVVNAGAIATPRGQVQMAAGDFFIVRPGQGPAANQTSTTRGNEVAPQFNADSTAGAVTNTGLLQAPEGDITLAGRKVVQDGVAVSTTTVDTRGTIHLLNAASDKLGSVTVTARGLNAILLDDQNGRTALDSQRDALIADSAVQDLARRVAAADVFDNLARLDDRRDQSRIEIVSGGGVVFEGGSTTLATGGQIAVSAKTGRSTVANGARLDVSGAVGVQVAMSSNNVEINIQGNEQRDAPLNRDTTMLNNSNVWIDRRKLLRVAAGTGGYDKERWYTPGGLLEVGGYLGLQGHTVGEWGAQGGSVVFAGNELVAQAGSNINLSGGTLDVQTGMIKQSWLKGADGRLYEVSSAPADVQYTGLYKGYEDAHKRWGDKTTGFFYNPLIGPQQRLENGYTVGRDAGQLIVSTGAAVLEGDISSGVYQGPRQTIKRDGGIDGYAQSHDAAALAAQLILGSYTSAFNTNAKNGPTGVFHNLAPTLDHIVFGSDQPTLGDGIAPDGPLPQARKDALHVDSDRLDGWGLGALIAVGRDSVRVDGALAVAPGGRIALHAQQVEVNADLIARGGSIALGNVLKTTATTGVTVETLMPSDPGHPTAVTVANGATLDTRGLWTNLQLDPSNGQGLPYVDGGTVDIRSAGAVTLAAGSLIDSSSGAALKANGALVAGHGGDVTLFAGYAVLPGDAPIDAPLRLDGEIRGFGVAGGGTLTLGSGRAVGIGAGVHGLNGTLAAGETTAVNLQLERDYLVAAGGTVPADFAVTVRAVAAGQTLAAATAPQIDAGASLTVAADWVVPAGGLYVQSTSGIYYFGGSVVPAGTALARFNGTLPAGYTIPGDAFPAGVPIAPVTTRYAAGTVVDSALRIPAGALVLGGSTALAALPVRAGTLLDTGLFQQGFSRYAVQGRDGLEVGDGTRLEVAMPVLRIDAERTRLVPTGAAPEAALSRWTPPVYAEDAEAATLTQRAGASLSLTAGALNATDHAPLRIGREARVAVDPGAAIALRADGQLSVEGRLDAWGGRIDLASLPQAQGANVLLSTAGQSVWIGEAAVLDVAGRAHVARDTQGRAYGVAPGGGTIAVGLSDAYVIVRPGALLDASGAAAEVDAAAGANGPALSRTVMLAGDGGGIEMRSYSGIVLDGTLRAQAGGANAFGGSLGLYLQERLQDPTREPVGEARNQLYTVRLVQNAAPSGLASDLAPGEADARLVYGQATLGADQVRAGGFDALTLSAHDRILFDGDLDLQLGRSLNLKRGVLTVADGTPDAQVRIAAPYIRLDGGNWDLKETLPPTFMPGLALAGGGAAPAGRSALTLSADLIDLYGAVLSGATGVKGAGSPDGVGSLPQTRVVLDGFADVALHSSGDVRLAGGFNVSGNLEVRAAQVYPMSGAYAALVAGNRPTGIAPDSTLTIRSSTGSVPEVPYSAFGQLVLLGGTVDQGGVVRAPLGNISINTLGGFLGTDWQAVLVLNGGPGFGPVNAKLTDPTVILRDGSLTSVSAAGMEMPFGGTVDGVSYAGLAKNGRYTTQYNLADTYVSRGDNSGTKSADTDALVSGISIGATRLVGEAGAVLDLSGGGVLHGEGFTSGRGGSVNVLNTPLVNTNPANASLRRFSQPGNGVYAIVPGHDPGYAPVILDKGAGDPAIGAQIEIGAGVPGLPAGTYTLMPASFALMPGAFRVELGAQLPLRSLGTAGAVTAAGGSWLASAVQRVAGTAKRAAVPTQVLLTPADAVRDLAQYNETGFSEFLLAQAEQFGTVRSRLPEDGKILDLQLRASDKMQEPLRFEGTALFGGATRGEARGIDGLMFVGSDGKLIEVRPRDAVDAVRDGSRLSLADSALNAFAAPSLAIGGAWRYFDGASTLGESARMYFGQDGREHPGVVLRDGTVLKAGQVFLVGDAISLEGGAGIDTRGFGGRVIDSALGYVYANSLASGQFAGGPAVLAVGNGLLDFLPSAGTSTIAVADGARLRTEGTIAFAAPGALELGEVDMGARYLTVAQNQISIGTAESLAAAAAAGVQPQGWHLTQAVLDRLLRPSAEAGVPALERLNLTAGGAFNFYGTVTLDTGDSPVQMVFATPAFYGWGSAGDTVRIATRNLVWNGIGTGVGSADNPYASVAPAPVQPGGPGTGGGRLVIDAQTVLFGYDALSRPQRQTALDRLALGFAGVEIHAADRVSANNAGSLTVGGTQAADGSRTGGDLRIVTPLWTGEAGSSMKYVAGGRLEAIAPDAGARADTAALDTLGASLALEARSVRLDTALALPSGRLSVRADGDIALGDGAAIDLAGRSIDFFDVRKSSWGGDLKLESAQGNIDLAAGSRVDVSAARQDAGSFSASAANGSVSLAGTLRAAGGGADFADGRFALTTARLGDDAFAQLNRQLGEAGFFGARSFTVKNGDLRVGDGVRAHEITIAVDGGSLRIGGTLDASGRGVGSIVLSARDELALEASALLDAHAGALAVDSRGAPIDAANRARIALSSSQGTVRLAGGASFDLRAADGIARGQLDINAPRTGETSGDLRIDAPAPLNIRGAKSVAVNAFWTYQPTDANGSVKQNNGDANGSPVGADGMVGLDQIDARSRAFIDAAWNNAGLQGRLAGLKIDGDAFHLRPGVEIRSSGDLHTVGDLDLSGYRYGPGANGTRGAGEAGVLTLRAGGELHIDGSINDGFAPPPDSPDSKVYREVLNSVTLETDYQVPAGGLTLAAGSQLPYGGVLGFDLALPANTLLTLSDDAPLPMDVVLGGNTLNNRVKANVVTTADIILPTGRVIPAGTNTSTLVGVIGTTTANLRLPAGTVLRAGMNAIQFSNVAIYGMRMVATTWRAGTDVAVLNGLELADPVELAAGSVLPAGMFVSSALAQTGSRAIWAIAPMLGAGSASWSMRLVGGADLGSSDSRVVRSQGGGITLNDPFQVNLQGKGLGPQAPGTSVVRTGTGDLELFAAGDYTQQSLYGVYTAGTWVPGTGAGTVWNAPRELQPDGTTLGSNLGDRDGYLAAIDPNRMWYTTGGGDFTLAAGGNIRGLQGSNSELVGGWLLRQGAGELGQATGWGVMFGSYVLDGPGVYADYAGLGLAAYAGLGALGGGNARVRAGGDIGTDLADTDLPTSGRGIVVAVGGSGRVIDGAVAQTGGGLLSVQADGRIYGGQYANLRGDTALRAASLGVMQLKSYSVSLNDDPRGLDPYIAYSAASRGGAVFAPGDGRVSVQTLGDLVLRGVIDPGRGIQRLETRVSLADGSEGAASSWYTLWTNATAIELFSAGGNLSPLGTASDTTTAFLPSVLRAVAPGGSIYFAGRQQDDYLMPSPTGQLELLAGNRVSGVSANNTSNAGSPIGLLGTSADAIATPLRPAWRAMTPGDFDDAALLASNYWRGGTSAIDGIANLIIYANAYSPYNGRYNGTGGTPFMFGPNTLSDDSMAGSGTVSHVYALRGDIQSVAIGEVRNIGSSFDGTQGQYFLASKPLRMLAGGDVVNSGGLIAHGSAAEVSMVAAGGDIFNQGSATGFAILGPGTLEVSAGGDIYLGNRASLTSLGPVSAADKRPGAGIVLQAGLGAGTPGEGASDVAGFAKRYLDPANLIDASGALADQPGKVAKTYDAELAAWLGERFGFSGTSAEALRYFEALPGEQQRVFVRQVFYAELTAGGREYNDVDSKRYGSYLRGREAIAALFPTLDAAGRPVARNGDITLFQGASTNAGVRTVAGGAIQTLTPGGSTVVGVEGVVPATGDEVTPAGLLTQGEGDIQMYSKGSILLGLSRIMTTFGGDILGWSAEGDINAGRGSKTTLVYTPPKREYDALGNVKLSPNVPSTGAGIATLDPIPEVPPGDVDLIAPLGTIDAGEAGIRVSGNVNLAALQVVNAANIQVKGESAGLPVIASVNVGALTNASAAASQATMAAQDTVQRERTAARQALPSVFTVRVLGFGNEQPEGRDGRDDAPKSSTGASLPPKERYDPANLVQLVGRGQDFRPGQLARLTEDERRRLLQDR
ncbi:filamentous hemagglutinin family N-terminal domain-containing protein [Variovorax sp. PDC80]|nr:filamentous hemagglutinin family N-terminal domain-containing protein [Variovorax sp. PDC80]